jgi:hypothetical protein
MGFWDIAKNVGTTVANSVSEKANEIRQLNDKYEGMSDEELIRIVNSDGFFGKSSIEKGVAFKILKLRGYDPSDLKSQ